MGSLIARKTQLVRMVNNISRSNHLLYTRETIAFRSGLVGDKQRREFFLNIGTPLPFAASALALRLASTADTNSSPSSSWSWTELITSSINDIEYRSWWDVCSKLFIEKKNYYFSFFLFSLYIFSIFCFVFENCLWNLKKEQEKARVEIARRQKK